MFPLPMAKSSALASPLARAGASAGALTAAAGILASTWRLDATQAVAASALGLSAVALHVRSLGVQLTTRALWMTSGFFASLALTAGGLGQRLAAIAVLGGSSLAFALSGRTGLTPEQSGTFQPARYRVALLVSMLLATFTVVNLTFFQVAIFDAFGSWGANLGYTVAIALGVYGLLRMRTWGLILLGAASTALAADAFFGFMALPTPVKTFLGVTSVAGLMGLTPLLALALGKLLRDREEPAERARVARFSEPAPAPALDLDAEAEREAEHEIHAAERPRVATDAPRR